MILATFNVRGFSLIELLVVLTVISLLTGFGLFGLSGYREGHSLHAVRDEAALISERTRSMAIYTGAEMTMRYDSASRTFWIEDESGNRQSDPEKIDPGVIVAGPIQVIFKGTGGLANETEIIYTFTSDSSGKALTMKIHPKTGRVEKEVA